MSYIDHETGTIWEDIKTAVVEAAEEAVHSITASEEHGNFVDTGKYDEKHEDHLREELGIWVAYAESGLSYDPDGHYLCKTCDMRQGTNQCKRVEGPINFVTGGSRLYIHGPELEPGEPMKQKLTQIQAGYAEKPKTKSFGCGHCEYSAKAIKPLQGRPSWCRFWGLHVIPTACCDMNGSKDMIVAPGNKKVEAAEEISQAGQFKGSIWKGIKIIGFSGPEEEGLRAMLSRIPPELFYNVKEIKSANELNAKHGRFIPETKTMLFNPGNFQLRQRFGKGDFWLYHPEMTVVHEVGHSIYEAFTPEEKQEWLNLGNWKKGWSVGQATAYVETRPGWEPGTSDWTHKAGLKLPRHYSEKNPNECFADCFSFFILGKAHQEDRGIKQFISRLIKDKVKRYPSVSIESPEKPYTEQITKPVSV